MYRRVSILIVALLIVPGCTTVQNHTEVPQLTEPAQSVEEASQTPLPEPTLSLELSSEPQHIEFGAEDGTMLVGTFWPPAPEQAPAPGALLMHWNPGSRQDWMLLAGLLQGQAIAGSQRQSYAVFAFDFRGHGESAGAQDRDGYLADARAALALFRTMPGVDAERIVLVGASIGADAAVDACGEGCMGAVSLSPGGFLNIPYADALEELGDKPVLCVASEGDPPSIAACRDGQAAGLSNYQVQSYQGSAHGMNMFDITEQIPALTDLIFEWLDSHVG